MKSVNQRQTDYDKIKDIFLERYSPRAMSGEAVEKEDLMTLFEAARWAPSASNLQPWRFIYTIRDTPAFDTFLTFLVPFNQDWCKNAAALVLVISEKMRIDHKGEKKENACHSLDTGSAWENLALQASQMDLVAHGMAGFDYAKAKETLALPAEYAVEMMIAVGKHGNIDSLPENLRPREVPSSRKPLSEIVFENKFPN